MSHKKFLVIDSRPYGFFSIFLHTIDNIKWAAINRRTPVIRWHSGRADPNKYREGASLASAKGHPSYVVDKENFVKDIDKRDNLKDCLYYQQEFGKNVWEYFFEPINNFKAEELKEEEYDVSDIFMVGDFDFDLNNKFLIKNVHSYDSLILWDLINSERELEHRKAVNKVIKENIVIKKEILNKFENFHNKKFINSDHYIGVHIRGTDKKTEFPHKTVSLEFYSNLIDKEIKNIKNLHGENKKIKIVIASDNNESIIYLANKYGKENIIAYPSMRLDSYLSNSFILFTDVKDKKKAGEEVLLEMLMLTKCDCLIGTDSNVTAAAAYFNPTMKLIYVDRKLGNQI
jgi:hypothetical protein